MQLVIITGLSGSGKTSAVHALEDIGFFCVDNLPILLLPGFVDLLISAQNGFTRIAVVMDIRGGVFLKEYPNAFQQVKDRGVALEVLFLETSTEVLLRRFEETRRPHPLSQYQTLLQGIEQERIQLKDLKSRADKVIDTTYLNVHQLRQSIMNVYSNEKRIPHIQIELISFSYSKGIPMHADILMDARFLPNPYYQAHLKDRNGNDSEVIRFIQQDHKATEVLNGFYQLVDSIVELCEYEDRSYLVIAIGCTGGRHRSVAVVNQLKGRLEKKYYQPKVIHRDLDAAFA
jgi:UPF0042 nucleotide-binding protein